MIIVQSKNCDLNFYKSIHDAQSDLEARDVSTGEYVNVCDENGLIYKLELLKKPGRLSEGSFQIILTDKYDREMPKRMLMALGERLLGFNQAKNIVDNIHSIKEANDQIIRQWKEKNTTKKFSS